MCIVFYTFLEIWPRHSQHDGQYSRLFLLKNCGFSNLECVVIAVTDMQYILYQYFLNRVIF